MVERRRILFVTGTRADFGKLKSLILATKQSGDFEVRVFVTGMHMHTRYGSTWIEVRKAGFTDDEVFRYINFTDEERMDLTLAHTVEGLSNYVREEHPDLIVVHGDRAEALAGALVGALNNILVAHIEGGELSGTIDELVRHSVSKMSHCHFVANEDARRRLVQMGETADSVYIIGSPDVDVMLSDRLPTLQDALDHYGIPFSGPYGIVLFHPVTTDLETTARHARVLVDQLLASSHHFVVARPNSDTGAHLIDQELTRLAEHPRFRIFPSIRFEYFLTLLKNAAVIVGNSSAGIREAPYYGTHTINIGSRQHGRSRDPEIVHLPEPTSGNLSAAIEQAFSGPRRSAVRAYGDGESDRRFVEALSRSEFWTRPTQKQFVDLDTLREKEAT